MDNLLDWDFEYLIIETNIENNKVVEKPVTINVKVFKFLNNGAVVMEVETGKLRVVNVYDLRVVV